MKDFVWYIYHSNLHEVKASAEVFFAHLIMQPSLYLIEMFSFFNVLSNSEYSNSIVMSVSSQCIFVVVFGA